MIDAASVCGVDPEVSCLEVVVPGLADWSLCTSIASGDVLSETRIVIN